MTDSKDKPTGSVYERVMAAAMEAKRLNNRQLMSNVTPRQKVTTEAIQRVDEGEVAYEMTENQKTPLTEEEIEFTESAGPANDSPTTNDEAKGENDTWTH